MDFEFYNADPPRTRLRWLLKPFRRLARRIQRPSFHRLRDLLTQLYNDNRELTAKLQLAEAGQATTAEQLAERFEGRLQTGLAGVAEQLEGRLQACLAGQAAAAEHLEGRLQTCQAGYETRQKVIAVDYLAMARRLARIEDLLIQSRTERKSGSAAA